MGTVKVGVSGWSYPHWRGSFYPRGLPHRAELAHLGERFDTLEVNGSFYSLQRPTSYAAWRDAVGPDVEFAVKGGRFVTHLKRLREVEAPLANFFASGVLELRDQLGPVLWQLSDTLVFDPEVLEAFFGLLPRTVGQTAALARRHDGKLPPERTVTRAPRGLADRPVRHTLEPRHPSFGSTEALELLREHGVGCVVAESAGRWPMFDAVTSDVVHVRLHGDTELYRSRYEDAALDRWAARVREWAVRADVRVYFDNDGYGNAPHDALRLADRLGLAPHRSGPR